MDQWVFGYGSLIWRPDFAFIDRSIAHLSGFTRRFWQGSHDHRGVPEQPGRVVTLVPEAEAVCTGVAYLVDQRTVTEVFEQLDHREKNGYERHTVTLELVDQRQVDGLVYVAPKDNFAYLGAAPMASIARQIALCEGPSGSNRDYLFELAHALREINATDAHVFALESAVQKHLHSKS